MYGGEPATASVRDSSPCAVEQFGQAEITDPGHVREHAASADLRTLTAWPRLLKQDVGRFEITVQDAALVNVIDGAGESGHQTSRQRNRHGRLPSS